MKMDMYYIVHVWVSSLMAKIVEVVRDTMTGTNSPHRKELETKFTLVYSEVEYSTFVRRKYLLAFKLSQEMEIFQRVLNILP